MGIFTKTVSFARRLSVFYLFTIIFSVFFGVFYYKFIPNNQAELNSRGFRILNQLSDNIVQKDANLVSTFDNLRLATPDKLPEVYDQISAQISFDSVDRKSMLPGKDSDHIRSLKGNEYCLVYSLPGDKSAVVRMEDFIAPMLGNRDDLFDSYVLLQRESANKDSARLMKILYIHQKITFSPGVSVDSAIGLQKNSDLADISTVTIGEEQYSLFFQPFMLEKNKLVLGGIVKKAAYDKKVKTLPIHFVVGAILVIMLGFIILPFVKVFFLSPKENVYKRDVLAVMLSVYIGSALLVLTACYFLADYSSSNRVGAILSDLAGKLENEIHAELDSAQNQLNKYADLYEKMPFKGVLCYRDSDSLHVAAVDSLFTPSVYHNVLRVFWIDSAGNTLAKWSPFTFNPGLSVVKNYPFFTLLNDKSDADTSMVLSAGKSNVTSEFQLLLSRRKRMPIVVGQSGKKGTRTVSSLGMVLAFDLNSGIRPVVPAGYGFCLIDNKSFRVIMHSDEHRNLSENFYHETNDNQRLKNCLEYHNASLIPDVQLYGASSILYLKPLRGQHLSLVVYYNRETCSNNIFRMVHFGAETILYITLAITVCILFSTGVASKPSKLSFNIDPLEWVRPSLANRCSYTFTLLYFFFLLIVGGLIFLMMLIWRLDIRIAFYISLLLPFYAVWGFLASRKKEKERFPSETKMFRQMLGSVTALGKAGEGKPSGTGRYNVYAVLRFLGAAKVMVLTLLLLNGFIFRLICKPSMEHGADVGWFVVIFQLLALTAMGLLYHFVFVGRDQVRRLIPDFRFSYLYSLYLSMLVISILPTMGFTWYGWTVEKLQYARGEQLSIADRNIDRMQYLSVGLLSSMKPAVLQRLNNWYCYTDTLVWGRGRYLAGQWIDTTEGYGRGSDCDTLRDPDDPYIALLDQLYLVTSGEYDSYSIPKIARDSSWKFSYCKPGTVVLDRSIHAGGIMGLSGTSDPIVQDFRVSSELDKRLFSWKDIGVFHGSIFFLVLLMFLYVVPRVLAMAVNRLFLLDFIKEGSTPIFANIIKRHFGGKTQPAEDFETDASGKRTARDDQEEYILRTMMINRKKYQEIWDQLTRQERYFLFDFASDGYVNYKDVDMVITLRDKGLLIYEDCELRLFSISFREFLLQKKGTEEVMWLREKYAVPGVWATIRIPTLIVIAACAVLLVMTQEDVSHRITVMITSVGAIIPVALEIVKKVSTKGAA